jgi:hypothetical protein
MFLQNVPKAMSIIKNKTSERTLYVMPIRVTPITGNIREKLLTEQSNYYYRSAGGRVQTTSHGQIS